MAVRDTVSRRLTYEDYLLFPEDGFRHELIDGEHFVTAAPSRKHQAVVALLTYFLVGFVRRHRLGTVLPAPFEIVLSDFDVVQPDLVFISRERAGILTEKNARGAPDLAIEILSPRTRQTDEVHKLRLYERSGVREYWLIDPLAETARIYRRRGERLALHRDLTAAGRGALTTPLLPGLRIPLAELCEE